MPKGSGKAIRRVEIELSPSDEQRVGLLRTMEARFEQHMDRHPRLAWQSVHDRLERDPDKLSSLYAMERTGGEPDVIGYDEETGEYVFCDCSAQSPSGRRSICYDHDGEQARIKKGVTPAGNAMDLASAMKVELMDEARYHELQKLGEFDTTTESWLLTPPEIRDLGGAIYGDRRYDRVFVGHNSAPSFYSSRGFRGVLRV